MNVSISQARVIARAVLAGALLVSFSGAADAVVYLKDKPGAPMKVIPTVMPDKPVALPDRSQTLVVDWVDTKNARLGIGGLTYGVRRAVPKIQLANGSEVNDIGYLKKGTPVKIQFTSDAQGVAHLTEVHVVGAAVGGAGGANGASGGSGGTTPANGNTPRGTTGSAVRPQ